MRTVERIIVSAVIFSKDGKFLQVLQIPTSRSVYPNCWSIIGGGVDEGEDFRIALNREVQEETGLDISLCDAELVHQAHGEGEKTLTTGEHVALKMHFHTYRVMIDQPACEISVTLSDEHAEYRWFLPSELKEVKIPPPSVELFTVLGFL